MTLLSSIITDSVTYIKYDMDMLKKRLEIQGQGHVRGKKEQLKQEQRTFLR